MALWYVTLNELRPDGATQATSGAGKSNLWAAYTAALAKAEALGVDMRGPAAVHWDAGFLRASRLIVGKSDCTLASHGSASGAYNVTIRRED